MIVIIPLLSQTMRDHLCHLIICIANRTFLKLKNPKCIIKLYFYPLPKVDFNFMINKNIRFVRGRGDIDKDVFFTVFIKKAWVSKACSILYMDCFNPKTFKSSLNWLYNNLMVNSDMP